MAWNEQDSFEDYQEEYRADSSPEKIGDILSQWLARWGDIEKARIDYAINRLIYECGGTPPKG
jgi:hypothetical protein